MAAKNCSPAAGRRRHCSDVTRRQDGRAGPGWGGDQPTRGFSFRLINGSARGASSISELLQSLPEDSFFLLLLLLLHPSRKPLDIYVPHLEEDLFHSHLQNGKDAYVLPLSSLSTKAVIHFLLPPSEVVNTADI